MMFAIGETLSPQRVIPGRGRSPRARNPLHGIRLWIPGSVATRRPRNDSNQLPENRLLPLPAAADLLLLALVLHLGDHAQHLEAELAVGLAVDLYGALVLDDVAGGGIDRDVAARAVGRSALERRDHLLAVVELAVELLDRVEDGVHRVPGGCC